MGILWVRRKPGAEATVGEGGERSFRRTYLVMCDTPNESRSRILASGVVPVYGAPHPEDFAATCVRVNPRQVAAHSHLWEVDCEWSTRHAGDKNEKEKQKAPDQRRPVWTYEFAPIQQYLPRDLDGKLFQDKAGSPFEPPPSIPIYVDHITVVRYERTLDRAFDRGFLNGTNVGTWNGAASKEALITNIKAQEVWEQNDYWWQRTFEILVSPRIMLPGNAGYWGGWDPYYVLNAGPRYKDDAGKLHTAGDEVGSVDGRAVKLDNDGKKLGAAADPIYLEFRVVNRVDFDPLELIPPE